MENKVQMIFVKPQFTGIEQAEKKEKAKNRNLTAASLAGIGAAAVAANTETGKNIVRPIYKGIQNAGNIVLNAVKNLPGKQPKPNKLIISDPVQYIIKKVDDGSKYVKNMNPKIRNASLAAAGLVALAHAKDMGEIQTKFQGYKGANEGANNFIEGVKNVINTIQNELGIEDKGSKKTCTCGQTPCVC